MKGIIERHPSQMYKNVNRRKRRDSLDGAMFTRSTRTNISISESKRTLEVHKPWWHSHTSREYDHGPAALKICTERSSASFVSWSNWRRSTRRVRTRSQSHWQPHRLHLATRSSRTSTCKCPTKTGICTRSSLTTSIPL